MSAGLRYQTRRTRIFQIPVSFIVALLTGRDGEVRTLKLLNEGIPDDAQVVGVNYDFDSNEIKIMVAHHSFPVVAEGCSAERLNIYFERGPEDHFLELL